MATTQYSNTEVFLQQLQDKEVAQQYQDECVFINEIAAGIPGQWVNQKGFEITSEFAPDPSHGYITAGGSEPGGGSNEYAKMYVGYARYRKSLEITNDDYDDMNAGKEAALVSFADKVARINSSGMRECEEAAMGNGLGIKAVVGAGSSTTNIVFTTTPTLTPFTSKGAQFLYKNHRYALYDSSNVLREANIVAAAVGKQGTTPFLTPVTTLSVTPASTDFLVYFDPGSGSSINRVHRGIRYLVNNTNTLFQGLLPTQFPELRSPMEDLAGAPLQPSHVMRLKNKIKYRRGVKAGQVAMLILGSVAQLEAYARTGINFLQLNVGQKWDGTINQVGMGDSKLMETTTLDEDCLYFLNKPDLKKIEKRKWGFIQDGTGQKLKQKQGTNGTGADAVYGNLGTDLNFYVKQRSAHGAIVRAAITDLATEATAWAA
jgi:hypothetical protein